VLFDGVRQVAGRSSGGEAGGGGSRELVRSGVGWQIPDPRCSGGRFIIADAVPE